VNVLALDGALGAFSAAIVRDGRVAASFSETGNVALERGLAIVEAVMSRAGAASDDLDRLAVGIGPGRFTGLRIAVAYAKALAAAWNRPLVPIQSFDILEYGGTFPRVLSVVEGRPGVISARYRAAASSGQATPAASEVRRASGRIADVLEALHPENETVVLGAPEDVLHALAERAIIVRSARPLITPAAAAAALSAAARAPARSLHEVRADYGELPAVTKRRR
jgi:tRNA threonylcarbamoyladenosine biosynthesis protein TsaB